MSSKTKVAVLASLGLTTALSAAILGLTARQVAFIQNHGRDTVDVSYYARDDARDRWVSSSTTIWYRPAQWTMRDTHALLAAGVLGAVLGAHSFFLCMRPNGVSAAKGRRDATTPRNPVSGQLAVLTLNSILTIVLVVATGVSWYQHSQRALLLLADRYLSRHGEYQRYDNPVQQWNFEAWNYNLAPRLRSSQSSAVSSPFLRSLCQQAKAARIMVLPALIFAVCALVLHLWAWKQHTAAVREHGEAAPPYDEVAWKQADLEAQGEDRSPVSPMDPVNPFADSRSAAVEMSGDHKTRAGSSKDSTVPEMAGDGGYGELDGGVAAAEKPAMDQVR